MAGAYILLLVTFLLSWVAVHLVFRFADRLGLMQKANVRSSHQGQRPTGGGIGVAVACTLAGWWISLAWRPEFFWLVAVILALALVGFLDDRTGLSVRLRLGTQLLSMIAILALVISWSGALRADGTVLFATLDLSILWIAPLIVIGGIYWINLFNFMDGIDGLATSQAIFLCFGLLILAIGVSDAQFDGMWLWCACVGCAAATFLWFNWAPARIFMGDAGAYFFSACIAVFSLCGIFFDQIKLESILILVAIFIADATITLVTRAAGGQNWWCAHKAHAYQNLSRIWGHRKTVLAYTVLNIFLLLPLAVFVELGWMAHWLGLIIAYAPLIGFAVWARAGQVEDV